MNPQNGLISHPFAKAGSLRWCALPQIGTGLLLILAAQMKAYGLFAEPSPEAGLVASAWFRLLLVHCEMALGLWLLVGSFPQAAWWTALVCFGFFACVAASQVIVGAASCGCFGAMRVNPKFTLALDIFCVAALGFARKGFSPRADRFRTPLAYFGAPSACFVLFLSGAIWTSAVAAFPPSQVSEDGRIVGSATNVLLQPEHWVGRRFPLENHIDIASDLMASEWTVVFYHRSCPKCQRLIAEYSSTLRFADFQPTSNIAIIEVPSFGSSVDVLVSDNPALLRGRLDPERTWVVSTPVVVTLKRGVVVGVKDGPSPEDAENSLY